MNIVFLSPHFPSHYGRFCMWLKEAGATVLGIGDAHYDSLTPELRWALTEYYKVQNMNDYDAILKACGFFTHGYGKIDRFESLNEHWLQTEARIRDDFNIAGIRGNEIDAIRRKSRMKECFRQAGLPVAPGRVVDSSDDAFNLIEETGYPVIAKPDSGVGALDTYKLNDRDEVIAFFAKKPDVDYIIEGFINGGLYSFDGLADREGNLVFYTAHVFSQGIMETVNEGRHMYYHSLRQIPPGLEKAGRACIDAFKVRERFFHMEFFKTGDDEFTALEVNMRPPGGFTTDMFNWANDIDIYRVWAELVAHGRTDLHYERNYHCCYASRKFQLEYVHSHEEIMQRYGAFIVQVESVPGVFASALGDVGYIFRSPDLDEIREIIDYIHLVQP